MFTVYLHSYTALIHTNTCAHLYVFMYVRCFPANTYTYICILHTLCMSDGLNNLLLAMDMAKVGGPLSEGLYFHVMCKSRVSLSGWFHNFGPAMTY